MQTFEKHGIPVYHEKINHKSWSGCVNIGQNRHSVKKPYQKYKETFPHEKELMHHEDITLINVCT